LYFFMVPIIPGPRVGLGFPSTMDNNSHIELCNRRLSQIWQLIQGLENDGVPPDSKAYDILSEKAEWWIARLETIGQVDTGNGFSPEVDDIIWN